MKAGSHPEKTNLYGDAGKKKQTIINHITKRAFSFTGSNTILPLLDSRPQRF